MRSDRAPVAADPSIEYVVDGRNRRVGKKVNGTLRAIGFQGFPIVVSVLLESIALCLLGAALGGAGAWLAFNGQVISTVNSASFTQIAFAFSVGPGLLVQAAALACVVGLLGGLPPALRAARMPIVEALRAL